MRGAHGTILSNRTIDRRFLAEVGRLQHFAKIQRSRVFSRAGKALRDLSLGQPLVDPQLSLDVAPDKPARARQVT